MQKIILKDEIRQLFYSLCRWNNLAKQLYKSLFDVILKWKQSLWTLKIVRQMILTNLFISLLTNSILKVHIKKNIGLVNLSIYYTLNLHTTTITLKYLFPLGMMNLVWLMVLGLIQSHRHSTLLWIYHQKTRNFGWKSSHTNLPQ